MSDFQNLRAINNMIRLKSEAKVEGKLDFTGKRTLEADASDDVGPSPAKQMNLFRRLHDVTSDRQETKVLIVK